MIDFFHFDVGDFDDSRHAKVHDGTDWCKVVQGHQRIHLVLRGAQEFLHHDKSQCLKDNASKLEHEADKDEFNFSEGSYNDTDYDEGNLEQGSHICFLGPEAPAGE